MKYHASCLYCDVTASSNNIFEDFFFFFFFLCMCMFESTSFKRVLGCLYSFEVVRLAFKVCELRDQRVLILFLCVEYLARV